MALWVLTLTVLLCNGHINIASGSNSTFEPTATGPTTGVHSSEQTTGSSSVPTTGPSAEATTGPSTAPTTGPSTTPTTGPSTAPTTGPSTELTTGPLRPTTEQPSEGHICNLKNCSPQNLTAASDIYQYCVDRNLTFSGRCCLNGSQIDGIDLSSCKITFDELTKHAEELENVQVMSLAGVTEPNCSESSLSKYFKGQTMLNTLILSNMCACPGGMSSWESIVLGDASVTCETQRDRCSLDEVKCPLTNTECMMNGPGADLLCQCSNGYSGYKCLRKGTFPITIFSIVTAIASGMISMLLWAANRKVFIKFVPHSAPVNIS